MVGYWRFPMDGVGWCCFIRLLACVGQSSNPSSLAIKKIATRMPFTWYQVLETRLWAGAFALIFFIVITYTLFRLASKEADKNARDKFWRPISVMAELCSALGVIATIAVAAQYFVKNESEALQESFTEATANRKGDAFMVSQFACTYMGASDKSFKQLSAIAQACEIGRNFMSETDHPLDDAEVELTRLIPLLDSGDNYLLDRVKSMNQSLHKEIEARNVLHNYRLQARLRPGESESLIIIIAIGVFVGATLKFSRALSEWFHRRNEG
jgi:hypothetical protein